MKSITALLIGAVLGAVLVLAVQLVSSPQCPTEDSCQVTYSHGVWSVREVTP